MNDKLYFLDANIDLTINNSESNEFIIDKNLSSNLKDLNEFENDSQLDTTKDNKNVLEFKSNEEFENESINNILESTSAPINEKTFRHNSRSESNEPQLKWYFRPFNKKINL